MPGIFDRPPAEPTKRAVRNILVDELGMWEAYDASNSKISGMTMIMLDHDVTGGVEAKVREAVDIAASLGGGIGTRIVEAGTLSAIQACECHELPNDWLGTEIKLVKSLP